ncbi:FUSC family protein, partial [Streptomyces sp. SID9727]|nr:FUSC family protein [Streptomyces sp. SID9727]
GAAELAEALRRATDQGAKAVRERRVPDWTPVREALERWEAECRAREEAAEGGAPPPAGTGLVRNNVALLLDALEDFSRGLAS